MKSILENRPALAAEVDKVAETAGYLWQKGWAERNGGNISYLLEESEVAQYLDLARVIRTIPLGFDASPLAGRILIVTGTGKYFKNVEADPEQNLGILRISPDGIRTVARAPSFAMSCAMMPAALASCAPLPG